MEWLIFEEEYYRAGAPQRVTQNGIFLLAPTLFEFGTPEQQDRILPEDGVGRGDVVPGLVGAERGQRPRRHQVAGRARRGGRRLAADGQKTWTTRGAFCDRLFGLFRTDPEAERHHGLTYFLVPLARRRRHRARLRPPRRRRGLRRGVPRRRVRARRATCSASVHEGWRVAMATTGSERGLTLRSPGRFMAAAGAARRALSRAPTTATGSDPTCATRSCAAWIDAEAYRLQTFWTVTRLSDGGQHGPGSRA